MAPQDALRLRQDLRIAPASGGSVTVHDPASGRYFRLGPVESFLLGRMDGRALEEARAEVLRAFPAVALSVEQVCAFAARAARLGWISGATAEPRRPPWWRQALRPRVGLGSPERLLGALDPMVRRLYQAPALAAALVLLAGVAAAGWWASGGPGATLAGGGLSRWAWAWVAFAVVSAVHECGHALTLRAFGGRSGAMGFMLLYGIPCFYCDVSDAWLLPSKRQRVLVSLAGLGWQFALAAVAAGLLPFFAPASAGGHLLRSILGLCGITALLNLNPLIRLDGYWVLCDWLEIPNLRSRSFAWLRARMGDFFGRAAKPASPISRREQLVYAAYGTAAALYSVALLLTLALAADRWVRLAW